MSESERSAPPEAPRPAAGGTAGGITGGAGGRYTRSSGGLVGAMLVTVLAVVAFAVFRGVTRDNAPVPVRTVDYAVAVKTARGDGQLMVVAPSALPKGWKATSATYDRGASPTWHLGFLTEGRRYVGVEESRSSIEALAQEHVDTDAERGRDVTIGGETWQTWTDAGGDYAVARSLQATGAPVESWLVVGTAPEQDIRDFAATLEGVTLPPAG